MLIMFETNVDGSMTNRIFAITVIILVVILLFTGCISSPEVVNKQNQKPQSIDVVDNKSTVNPTPVTQKPDYQEKIVFWSLRDCMWVWDWSKGSMVLGGDNYEIYIMDTDGKNQVNLTNNKGADLIPSLSPDGKSILFVSNRKWGPDNKEDTNWDIFIMDVDGGNVINLTGSPKWDSMPSWSPDGRMIVFCSTHSGKDCIWIMDREGNKFLNLTPNRNRDDWDYPIWPSWSPDWNRIYYTSGQEGSYNIFYYEIDYELIKKIVLSLASTATARAI